MSSLTSSLSRGGESFSKSLPLEGRVKLGGFVVDAFAEAAVSDQRGGVSGSTVPREISTLRIPLAGVKEQRQYSTKDLNHPASG
jgi:hypothetical protein